jgi:hypothetical protein
MSVVRNRISIDSKVRTLKLKDMVGRRKSAEFDKIAFEPQKNT